MNMMWMMVLGFVPLIVFVVVDAYSSTKAGIIAAIVLAILVYVVNALWVVRSFTDPSILVEPVFIVLLGSLGLAMSKPELFKFQPSVVGVVLALLLAYFQYFDTPFMLKYEHFFEQAQGLPPEVRASLQSEDFKRLLVKITEHLIYLLVFHAAIMVWAAIKLKNAWWLTLRLAFYPCWFLLVIIDFVLYWKAV